MKKRVRIFAHLPMWKPCLKAFDGTEEAYEEVLFAINAINGIVGRVILSVTIEDK